MKTTTQRLTWFTVNSRKPGGASPFQPLKFPSWVTGSHEIAEAHLLDRIASEGNPRLKIYGFDGFRWVAVG